MPTGVLLYAIVLLLLLIVALLFILLLRWLDLREDLRNLRGMLRGTEARYNLMNEEIVTLGSRLRSMQNTLLGVTDRLSRTRAVTVLPREAPKEKPGRTVYDHLMADDDLEAP